MKLNAIRLLFVAVVVAVLSSLSSNEPDNVLGKPTEVKNYHFQFGITVQAEEDCDDGTAEHQQCGGSFGIEGPIGGGGGGGGGQQRRDGCNYFSHKECSGENCIPRIPSSEYATFHYVCYSNGVPTGQTETKPAGCCDPWS